MDDDDKVRRNLVMASAAVILVWFLEIPISKFLADAVKDKDWSPAPWRIWAFVLIALLYLALRFRFSGGSKQMFGALGAQYRMAVPRLTSSHIQAKCVSVPEGRILSRTWTEACQEYQEQAKKVISPSAAYSYQYNGVVIRRSAGFSGAVSILISAVGDVNAQGAMNTLHSDGVDATYDVIGWPRYKIWLAAVVESCIYSELAIESFAPAVLWLGAVVITLSRLTQAMFA